MKLLLSTFLIFVITACAGDDNEVSEEEIQILRDCFDTPLIKEQELQENFPGEWKLEGYACTFCPTGPTVKSNIMVNRDGSGYFEIDYAFIDQKESKEFRWKIVSNPRLRIETDPTIWEITGGVMCSDYLVQNGLVNDGDLLIYEKQ